MDKYIAGFPHQLRHAMEITDFFTLPGNGDFKRVVVSGMGGSAIGASFVHDMIKGQCDMAFTVNRSYNFPEYSGRDTLAIFSSYSGNTEETISAFSLARKNDCTVVCIASGGLLQKAAVSDNLPLISIPGGMPPRTCVGYSIIALLSVLNAAGCISNSFLSEIKAIAGSLEENVVSIKSDAEKIAAKLTNKTPIIYTSDAIESVGLR
ncbi:MAG: hypothetical protein ACK4IY_01130, partial [Chitinophagales bacterium]